jgi:hypothetical protein
MNEHQLSIQSNGKCVKYEYPGEVEGLSRGFHNQPDSQLEQGQKHERLAQENDTTHTIPRGTANMG